MRERMNSAAPVISSIVSPRTRMRHQERPHLRWGRDAGHHGIERGAHFGAIQRRAGRYLVDDVFEFLLGHGVLALAVCNVQGAGD